MKKNKVKFGLKNVHIAKMTVADDGNGGEAYSYASPKAWPGAVNLSMEMQGGLSPFYADDRKYYTTYSNNGYEGDLESALVPDHIYTDIFGDTVDENGILVENTTDQPARFALLFEFDGDQTGTRHVLYDCTMTRPSIASATTEDTAEPQTETSTISAAKRADGLLHAKSTADADQAVYNGWYEAVYVPDVTAEAAQLSDISIGNISLTPEFDAGTTAYTATTSNATNTVTATGADGAEVAIVVNGTSVDSGSSVTWEDGNNSVRITASAAGKTSTTYYITVVKA